MSDGLKPLASAIPVPPPPLLVPLSLFAVLFNLVLQKLSINAQTITSVNCQILSFHVLILSPLFRLKISHELKHPYQIYLLREHLLIT